MPLNISVCPPPTTGDHATGNSGNHICLPVAPEEEIKE